MQTAARRTFPSRQKRTKEKAADPFESAASGGDGGIRTHVPDYSAQSIQRWCNQKILVGFKIRGTLTIPRLAVVEFMSGDRATAIVRKSSKHLDLLRTYAQDCHEGAMTITY